MAESAEAGDLLREAARRNPRKRRRTGHKKRRRQKHRANESWSGAGQLAETEAPWRDLGNLDVLLLLRSQVGPAHDEELGGVGGRREDMRASSLAATSVNLTETSRRNSAVRRSVSGATSSSM